MDSSGSGSGNNHINIGGKKIQVPTGDIQLETRGPESVLSSAKEQRRSTSILFFKLSDKQ